MLEAAARAVDAESKGAEGAAQGSAWRPHLGLGPADGHALLLPVSRVHTFGDLEVLATLDVQEVTTGAEGADAHRLEGAAGDVPAALVLVLGGALLGGIVDKQAAAAVVAVSAGVVAAAQLRLVLWVVEGNVELVEAVGKLTALRVLAETRSRVAGAQLGLVPGGADPRHAGSGGVHQREQSVGQGDATAATRLCTRQQVVHHLLVLARRQERVVNTRLKERERERTVSFLGQLIIF